ncbi:NAD-dependent epimerase/dehydratase family protein [Candidatus Woesearchaeota archaeon]|nr:NAD-dependent epimerase/dehydratase family protein [Candidatus Woesearchaeota archaeon]
MARCLVTGGAGFIGSHIVDALLAREDEVVVIDNFFDSKRENLDHVKDRIELVEGDIRDKELMDRLCRGTDFIFHEAARRSVPASLKDPFEYNDVNINGTLNILEAARKNDVKRVISASSSSVNGDAEVFPQKEDVNPDPRSPYALTKLAAEKYLRIYWKLYGLETVSLRYFNVFGPRQDPNSQYAVVIPLFIKAISDGKPPVIFGDGSQSRDYTYVANVVEGNILASQAPKEKAAGEVFNIADGNSISVNELAERINKMLGKDIKPEHTEERPGDVQKTQADNSKAKELLGYEGKVSFEQGLKNTVEWFRKELSK